ncbi:EAL domain-containing protein [Thiorhodococcus fuscus]|uniref:EAL domain-containing protein n=1 Tax=Thiorhodococcus fuscus TaxID=527200 RepID=A0ABW4Y4C0_9GAMM
MLQKDSIKFQLLLVISLIIFLLLVVLFGIQIKNALNLEARIETSSIEALKDYDEQEQQLFTDHFQKDIQQYIQMLAFSVSQELYDFNRTSLQDKSRKFLQHDAICSIVIIDALSGKPISQASKQSTRECVDRSIDIQHKGKPIGRLDVSYSLAPFAATIAMRESQMNKIRADLHSEIRSITRQSILVQTIIYAITTTALLLLVARQINHGIIQPVYSLLADMQSMANGTPEQKHPSARTNPNIELGRLNQYFHEHIAKLIAKLNQLANYDSLTMLFSRQRLIFDIKNVHHFNLAILDIDRFREINDLLGMDAGDELLQATARSLRVHFSKHNYSVYRLNSDEFAVLDEGPEPLDIFEKQIKDFLQHFDEEELPVKGQIVAASITAGICNQSHPSPIVAASTALNHAKSTQLKTAIYNDALPILNEYQRNLRTTRLIRKAIAEDWIIPYYQPIQDIQTGVVNKYEVLMRIGDAEGRIYHPAEFLEISKRSDTYRRLSTRTITKAIAESSASDVTLSINLSIEDIERNDILATLRDLHERYGMTNRVIFEITEQEGFSNPDKIKSFIRETKRLGARFAIDDFGSGFSSFETLIHLDVDFIKIDGSLIRDITTDKNSEIVVETIVEFAEKLGIKTIAEFVADQAIFDTVESMGVHFAQGYLIGKPAPACARGMAGIGFNPSLSI